MSEYVHVDLDLQIAMLLILIPISWLAVLLLLLCVCRVAARGEEMPAPAPGAAMGSLHPIGGGLVVYDARLEIALQGRRTRRVTSPPAPRRRAAAHGLR